MSLEKNIERIADALELIAEGAVNGSMEGGVLTEGGTSASDRPKATRKEGKKTPEEKKAAAAAKRAAKKAEKDEPKGPTREDVSDALMEFCKNGPGKTAAKEILEEFKAGSISTLDVKTYEAFIARLNEVSGG